MGYRERLQETETLHGPNDLDYRFFNVAFACVLYNVWRLVDLLVKFAIDDEYRTYAPLVDANQFLTVAKQWYGLDPPD